MSDFWLFGYGSLMWNPGFFYDNAILARLDGYHRSLCIYSTYHRGTSENPGLVLGLDKGGSCQGLAFHVPQENAEETYQYLRDREQPNGVYHEKWLDIALDDGRSVCALTFVADQKHMQYAGSLSFEKMVQIVKNAQGISGANIEYVVKTTQLLQQKNIKDASLERLTFLLQNSA